MNLSLSKDIWENYLQMKGMNNLKNNLVGEVFVQSEKIIETMQHINLNKKLLNQVLEKVFEKVLSDSLLILRRKCWVFQ